MILSYCSTREAVTESRNAAKFADVGDHRVLCRVLGKWRMFLDDRDISQMPYLSLDGIHKPHVLEHLCAAIRPGMIVADVGASFGYLSLLAGELVGDSGRVVAFEPKKRVFHLLKQNVEMNGLRGTVTAFPMALGAAVGKGELTQPSQRYLDSTMAPKAVRQTSTEDASLPVEVSTIDALLLPRQAPDFFILATSGYEPQVWQGMRGALGSKRKIGMLMEFTHRWYDEPEKFAEEILDNAFIANRIHPDGALEPLTDPTHFMGPHKSDILLSR